MRCKEGHDLEMHTKYPSLSSVSYVDQNKNAKIMYKVYVWIKNYVQLFTYQ